MSLFESSNKGLKFETPGTSHTGTVKAAPRERQQTKFGSQEPDFWPNGDPKMQILVDLQTDRREDPNDDGTRTLYVASKNMKKAIGDAIRTSGASDLLPGGVLTLQYVGNDPASANPANPAKLYAASYTPPVSGFVQQPAAAAPAPQPVQAPAAVPSAPQPTQAPFVAPAAAAPPAHGLNEQQVAQLQQLRAAQIPEATIATAINATPQQIAQYDATPF